jgi:hypothetical protein
MRKVFILSLVMASLLVNLLSSGVAAEEVQGGQCTLDYGDTSYTVYTSEWICENLSGSWVQGGSHHTIHCCLPDKEECCPCYCVLTSEWICALYGGMEVTTCNWKTNSVCKDFHTEDGKCVPEASTIALLATGLICLAGYFRLRRKEE